jgi:hypothetical protein
MASQSGTVGGCSRDGCERLGIYYAVICVPALGGKRSQPLRMIVDLPLCEDHHSELDVANFLLPESRQRVRIALMARGKAMPNFRIAWKERGVIGDRDWQAFLGVRGGH